MRGSGLTGSVFQVLAAFRWMTPALGRKHFGQGGESMLKRFVSKRRRLAAVAVVSVAVIAVSCGVAIAAGVSVSLPFSGDGNTINGCYSSGGALKIKTPS